MKAVLPYLRKHPWRRRILTAALAMLAGILAAIASYPILRDHLLLRRLGSDDPAERTRAIAQATALADEHPRTLRRLEQALHTEDDRKFLAVAEVLWNLELFHAPGRDGAIIDRWRTLQLVRPLGEDYTDAELESRALLLGRMIADGRDNRHVRRALETSFDSPARELRLLSATLAARLADCETLGRLLDDEDETVATDAALSAAAARCNALADKLAAIVRQRDDLELVSSAAYALAVIDAETWSELVIGRMPQADRPKLRDRLFLVASMLEGTGPAVAEALEHSRQDDGFPSAAAMSAAARVRLTEADQAARDVLAAAAEGSDKLTEPQVLAAIELARSLNVPVGRELNSYCRRLWSRRLSVSMAAAARLLAEQTERTREDDPELADSVIDTLRRAALYRPPEPDADSPAPPATPRASAEAAFGLWILEADDAEDYLRRVAGREGSLRGDTIAWRLSRSDADAAIELGLRMLPPPGAPPEQRVYRDNERAAGAMLLALSARTPEQRQQARRRIRRRMDTVTEPFIVRGSLHCGLVVLGEQDSRPVVREMLTGGIFPPRRALTALAAAGDATALDWLLWNPSLSDGEVLELLVEDGLAEVLAVVVPELPPVDPGAEPELRLWQLRILRQYYMVRREHIRAGVDR